MAGASDAQVVLRRYEARDRTAVQDLHRRALEATGAYLGPGPWDADLEDVEGHYHRGGGLFLVAEEGGRVVGMGGLQMARTPGRALIKRMRVEPALQGRGIGRAILGALEAYARAAGLSALALDTTTVQARALALYGRSGYRETGRRRLRGFEVVLMEKNLDTAPDG